MNIQLYAKRVNVEADDAKDVNVYLYGIDESQVLAEFSAKDKLDSVDKGDIMDYLHQLKEEDE